MTDFSGTLMLSNEFVVIGRAGQLTTTWGTFGS